MDAPANQHISPSPENPRWLHDPELAGYDLLRRLICGRPPFDEGEPEKSAIPGEFKSDIEFGTWAYQISLYLEAVKVKIGPAISEQIRTHLLSLSAFDAGLEPRLTRFFDAIRTAGEKYADTRYGKIFDNPAAEYYATLAIVFLIASGCPEECQRPLVVPFTERLVMARVRAEVVFERELGPFQGISDSFAPWRAPKTENNRGLGSITGVNESFQWSAEPGPFERQLRRQQNNPLFPATVRTISAGQVNDARMIDLRRMADFMSAYRPIVNEVMSKKTMVAKQASDLEKAIIDLIPSCMVVGDYFSNELKVLETASDTIDQELARTTNEPSLRDVYKSVVAMARIQGRLLEISIDLPSSDGTEDFPLRSILSESLGLIWLNAQLLGSTGFPDDEPLDAERIISEAIREGLDPSLGRQKLDAFSRGFSEGRKLIGKSEPRAGFWANVKRVVRRPDDK